eukprot:8210420-Pyramimonas_sp.AAC.1
MRPFVERTSGSGAPTSQQFATGGCMLLGTRLCYQAHLYVTKHTSMLLSTPLYYQARLHVTKHASMLPSTMCQPSVTRQ